MPNLRERLLASLSKPTLTPVTFGGIECFVKKWSEKENIEWAVYCQTAKADDGAGDLYVRCRAIAWSLTDAEGVLVFDKEKDIEVIASFPSDEIGQAFTAVIEVQNKGQDDSKNS